MYRSTPLPPDLELQIDALAAGFSDVTDPYKFYWFHAILAHLQETQETVVPVDQLIARMVADVWYSSNYFRLSFGKQDRLGQIAAGLRSDHDLPVNAPKPEIINAALAALQREAAAWAGTVESGQICAISVLATFFWRSVTRSCRLESQRCDSQVRRWVLHRTGCALSLSLHRSACSGDRNSSAVGDLPSTQLCHCHWLLPLALDQLPAAQQSQCAQYRRQDLSARASRPKCRPEGFGAWC